MARIVIYDTTAIDKAQISEGLEGSEHELIFKKEKISLKNIDKKAEVIAVFVSSSVNREIIEAMPKLKLIACRSTGFNNIDLIAAEQNDVKVTTVPSYGDQTVAEYTFALLLMLSRRLKEATDLIKQQNLPASQFRGFDLAGKTMGIIGTGKIGTHVAKIAHGFGMKLLAYDVIENKDLIKLTGIEYTTLDELLRRSDVVSLHTPYMKQTHHLLSAEKLAKMKKTAVIINTARGELIDTEALITALMKKRLAGAALDVLEGESLWHLDDKVNLLKNNSMTHDDAQKSLMQLSLAQLPNVVLSPHNAYNTIEAIGRINSTTCKNIINFYKGRVPNKVVVQKPEIGKLVVVRHAESELNKLGRWAGWTDTHLSDQGYKDAAKLGKFLERLNIKIDFAYCSKLVRTRETLEIMLSSIGQSEMDVTVAQELNERNYGDLTGLDKWEVKERIGAKEFQSLRRGWNHPIPNGETLKMVYERALPYYQQEVVPKLLAGHNVLIVGHGNVLRSLMKYIESLTIEQVSQLEVKLGQVVSYDIQEDGKMLSKRIDQFSVQSKA